MTICGKYVNTFLEASHALPEGMHMNADYPFKLPSIIAADSEFVNLRGSNGEAMTAPIERKNGREYCVIYQKSTFEVLYGRKPQKFVCYPFKDENTPAINDQPRALVREG